MGYRGKTAAQAQARELRAEGRSLADIAEALAVSKSSVSLWVRDVEFTPGPRRPGRRRGPNALQRRKADEIERLMAEGRDRIGRLSERDFPRRRRRAVRRGGKTDGAVKFTNSDARMISFFCAWLRHFFQPVESRLRLRLYLHEGLDLAEANAFWSRLTQIPVTQFHAPYRATPDPTIRKAKHPMGCPAVVYGCTRTHRAVMGLVGALLTCEAAIPG